MFIRMGTALAADRGRQEAMSRWAYAMRLAATFALGCAVALWLLPIIAGPMVQRLRLERDEALARVEMLEAEVSKLQAAERRPVVCAITRARSEIEGPDERVGLEAARRIQKELAAEQIGRQLDNVSFLILYGRYHGRLMEIDGVTYQLEVQGLSVGPELALFGRLSRVDGKEAPPQGRD